MYLHARLHTFGYQPFAVVQNVTNKLARTRVEARSLFMSYNSLTVAATAPGTTTSQSRHPGNTDGRTHSHEYYSKHTSKATSIGEDMQAAAKSVIL